LQAIQHRQTLKSDAVLTLTDLPLDFFLSKLPELGKFLRNCRTIFFNREVFILEGSPSSGNAFSQGEVGCCNED